MKYYIYRFFNENNDIIYIGRTSDIVNRLEKQHFTRNGHLPFECYKETKRIEYCEVNSDRELTIYEMYYVSLLKPKYNQIFNKENEVVKIEIPDLKWKPYKRKNDNLENERTKKVIIARLRPGKDDDIRQALQELPPYHDESDILRAALRQFLFGHKKDNKRV